MNFNELFRKVIQQDNKTWEALALLKELKQTVSGYYYRFNLDENNFHDAIIFMTPTMRYNLSRFGSLIFLDTIKR